ncbi:MAG: pyruvate dehydrogenase (acetyl-transferring) E1 component subunit alpha [Bacteroidales bacterium]
MANEQLAERRLTLSREQLIDMLEKMLLGRRFEERAAEMYAMQKIGGFCHLYIGQEAVAVGAISLLRPDDYIFCSYRDHVQAIVKGTDPRRVMAELFGRETGVSRGKGGSMHMFDVEKGLMGGHGIVGGHIPLATGAAFAIKYEQKSSVVLCFFGEAAVNIGTFHESLNMAALWKLPVVYICENNRYGMGTAIERASAIYDVAQRACAYDIASETVDGMDVLAVHDAVGRAVELARSKSLPSLIEARCYRFMGHSMSDPVHGHYRTKQEVEEQKRHDPIRHFFERLSDQGVIDQKGFEAMDTRVRAVVEDAVNFADASPQPPEDELYLDVYAEPYGPYKRSPEP